MWKKSLIYGLIGGIAIVILLVVPHALFLESEGWDLAKSELYGYVVMVVALSTIFFGVRSYRDQELGGQITFGKAFGTGLIISLVASVLYVVGWMLLSDPAFVDNYSQQYLEGLRSDGASEADIQQAMQDMETYKELNKNPFFKAGLTLMEIFPVGLMISLASALYLRTKNRTSASDPVNK